MQDQQRKPPSIALTIAGSDSGGGAGIQADLKVFASLKLHGVTAITALTAQNTLTVEKVHTPPADFLKSQLDILMADFNIKAGKIGMIPNLKIAKIINDFLSKKPDLPMVFDPVLIATSGDRLAGDDMADYFLNQLMIRAVIITPNLFEAAVLLGEDMAGDLPKMKHQAAHLIGHGAKAVYLKGGHGKGAEVIDIFHDGRVSHVLKFPRIHTPHTHGTGCTLSALIAGFLAKDYPLERAVQKARLQMQDWLVGSTHMNIGHGPGPLDHFAEAVKAP